MIQPRRYKVRPWTPTPEQQEHLRATRTTSEFLHHLPEEIRSRHAGEWIAAQNCRIVATAPTMEELFAKLPDPDDNTVLMIRIERGVTIRWRRPS